jgi:hypothetical protein
MKNCRNIIRPKRDFIGIIMVAVLSWLALGKI